MSDQSNTLKSSITDPKAIQKDASKNCPTGGIIKLNTNQYDMLLNKPAKNDAREREMSRKLWDPNDSAKRSINHRSMHEIQEKEPSKSNESNINGDAATKEVSYSKDKRGKVKNLFLQIQSIEDQIKKEIGQLSNTNSKVEDSIHKINQLRNELMEVCHESIFTHIETAFELNIDVCSWRTCFHLLIENLRDNNLASIEIKNQMDNTAWNLDSLISEGIDFYNKLIRELEQRFVKFKHEHYIDINYFERCQLIIREAMKDSSSDIPTLKPAFKTKESKFAFMVIQRSLIFLGDLERYRQVFSGQKNYSEAKLNYRKAMLLAPKSSRAYNQLAILSVYLKRRLDACYYYFRCLEVSVPLSTVRQSLNSIFEECRLKKEATKKKLKVLDKPKTKKTEQHVSDSSSLNPQTQEMFKKRIEKWYKPSGINLAAKISSLNISDGSSDSEEETTSDNKLKNVETSQLFDYFILSYIDLIGKLFTKVGMETFDEDCSQILSHFGELLNRSPCPLEKMVLLQVVVVNISIIDLTFKNSQTKNSATNSESINLTQQPDKAIELSIDIFTILVKRCNKLLKKTADSQQDQISECSNILVSISVFIQWLSNTLPLWNPSLSKFSTKKVYCFWKSMIDLFNLCGKTKQLDGEEITSSSYHIKLEEDLELAGFEPLSDISKSDESKVCFISKENFQEILQLKESSVELEKNSRRVQKILSFAKVYCNFQNQQYLEFNQDLNEYSFKQSFLSKQEKFAFNKKIDAPNNIEKKTEKSVSIVEAQKHDNLQNNEDEEILNPAGLELSRLKERYNELKLALQEQENTKLQSSSLLYDKTFKEVVLELEIRPKYIIPDTNCLINHLDLIDAIVESNYFVVIVPLMVVGELEKLTKLTQNDYDGSWSHGENLKANAHKALALLNSKLNSKHNNLKAITSEGSILETIRFKTEELSAKGTNDEHILRCCAKLLENKGQQIVAFDGESLRIRKEVVLLTDDKHLRMKAHIKNVPVKSGKLFCKWAGII